MVTVTIDHKVTNIYKAMTVTVDHKATNIYKAMTVTVDQIRLFHAKNGFHGILCNKNI